MEIIKFLTSKIELNQEIMTILEKEMRINSYKKGEHILLPGNKNKRVYFVEKGLARMYYNKEDKAITHMFFDKGTLFTNIEVVYYDEKSPYGIECLEDSVMTSMSFDRIFELAKDFPFIDEIARNILWESLYKLSNRLRSMQLQTAEERYNDLLEKHPEILQRAPLGHIASFLGISQPTLSVIRGKK